MVWTTTNHLTRFCALAAWSGDPDRCRWCNELVADGQQWCGYACEEAHAAQHAWVDAREARLRQDGSCCAECGTGPDTPALGRVLLRALIPMSSVEAAALWRSESWLHFELACSVDVVHRLPVRSGYRSGCHNHLDRLLTLCHECRDARAGSIDLRQVS